MHVPAHTVRAGPLGNDDAVEDEWHHMAGHEVKECASENTRCWKSAGRQWATDKLNKVTRSVLSLSSEYYSYLGGAGVHF